MVEKDKQTIKPFQLRLAKLLFENGVQVYPDEIQRFRQKLSNIDGREWSCDGKTKGFNGIYDGFKMQLVCWDSIEDCLKSGITIAVDRSFDGIDVYRVRAKNSQLW